MTLQINSNQSSTPTTTAPAGTATTIGALEHVSTIIPRTKLGKALLGKTISCRFCKGGAYIYMQDKRYMVHCGTCGDDTYLKTYNI
jgi:hypothetical protein